MRRATWCCTAEPGGRGGLSWPGRSSHSPAEVLDLRDPELLVERIGVVVLLR